MLRQYAIATGEARLWARVIDQVAGRLPPAKASTPSFQDSARRVSASRVIQRAPEAGCVERHEHRAPLDADDGLEESLRFGLAEHDRDRPSFAGQGDPVDGTIADGAERDARP